ncbi:MAG TPA: hypothetical protein DIW17_04035 [Clostridiales bacterium]|nr:hypothetical protein [Clostridiales bacterium]
MYTKPSDPPYRLLARSKRMLTPLRVHHIPAYTLFGTHVCNKKTTEEPDGKEAESKPMKKIMAKNLEELRAENPELAEQILAEAQATVSANAAVETERRRIAEIDEIAALYDDETVKRLSLARSLVQLRRWLFPRQRNLQTKIRRERYKECRPILIYLTPIT